MGKDYRWEPGGSLISPTVASGSVPGKRTIAESLTVQRRATQDASTDDVHKAAAVGTSTPAESLPYLDQIQSSFGPAHDVSSIKAHVGGLSAAACQDMGASAFATGDHTAFAATPDLHTAAHEAAHVVQQANGVNLYGGVGEAGDEYERHADAVADRVVAGESASDLLPRTTSVTSAAMVQRQATGEPVPSGQQILHADRTDASSVSDPVALVNMMKNRVDLMAMLQQSRMTRAIDLIKLPKPEKKMSVLDRILRAAITFTVDVLTDGMSDLLFAGAKGAVVHGASEEAASGVIGEVVENTAKSVVKAGPAALGDAAKEKTSDTMKGESDGGREMSYQELLIEYNAQVSSNIADSITNAKDDIDKNRTKWEMRPVTELQARVQELTQIAERQKGEYDRTVMMGWMDLRARLSTAHEATPGQPETMMPEANQREQKGSLQEWWNANPGFINIYFSTPANVSGVDDLSIERVTINAEESIVKELREANLSLGDLPVPRRVRFDSIDGEGGLAPGLNAPWFVITSTGEIEVAPGVAHRVLSMIGSGRGGAADGVHDDSSQPSAGGAVANANEGILHAQDLAAAMRGARLVRDRLRGYTTKYMIPEE